MIFKLVPLLLLTPLFAAHGRFEYDGNLMLTQRQVEEENYWLGSRLDLNLKQTINEKRDDFGLVVRPGDEFRFSSEIEFNNEAEKDSDKLVYETRELGFKYQFSKNISIFFGETIVIWGKADEINPTDVWNAEDLSLFFSQDKARRKRARPMLIYEFIRGNKKFQVIGAIQDQKMRHKFAAAGTPWCSTHCQSFDEKTIQALLAANGLTGSYTHIKSNHILDLGFRFSNTTKGYDYSFSYYNGTERFPIFTREFLSPTHIEFAPYQKSLESFGFDLSKAVDRFTIFFEGKYSLDRPYFIEQTSPLFLTDEDGIVEGNEVEWILGADAQLPADFYVNIQYYERRLTESIDDPYFWGGRKLVTFTVTKTLLEDFKLEFSHLNDWNTKDYSETFLLEYALNDNIKFDIGITLIRSEEEDSLFAGLDEADYGHFNLHASF